MSFLIRELHPEDNCTKLKLGRPEYAPLKTFFAKDAKALAQEHIAKTFVLIDSVENRVCGYATTVCAQLSVEEYEMPELLSGYKYRDYPGIKLARLAVDHRYQNQGLGSRLVDFLLGITLTKVQPNTGCRLMFVDAKKDSVSFYERLGFNCVLPVNRASTRKTVTMWLDLLKV
jgi:GNAT superfamily N-acetyltransferase